MKKLIVLLLTLTASIFAAGDIYFTRDTIYTRKDGDTDTIRTYLVNNSTDTVHIDSIAIDSLTGFYDEILPIKTWIYLSYTILTLKEAGIDTFPSVIPDTSGFVENSPASLIFPSDSTEIWNVYNTNSNKWKKGFIDSGLLADFYTHCTIYCNTGNYQFTMAGVWLKDTTISTAISSPQKITSPHKKLTQNKGYIYNIKGQIVGTKPTDIDHLSQGILLQGNQKSLTTTLKGELR